MRWSIRDVAGEYDLETGRALPRDHEAVGEGGDARELDADAAVGLLGDLARDPRHMATLRAIYFELSPEAGTVSDFVVVPSLFDAVFMGRLRISKRPTRIVRSEPIEIADLADEPAPMDLALLAAPAPAPVAAPSTEVAHQVAILLRASQNGTPLCEECECE
jgi:hypothetical protein